MAPLKILICGGGCAGPAAAFWLARAGHNVVIVERFPSLRASGAQVDLRAQGIQAVKRMGLLEEVRSKLVDEDGVALVDAQGRAWATVMANKSGKGAQTMTSEFEIMRGDLVRILYEATKGNAEYRFGKTVDSFEQRHDDIVARFSDGQTETFDLLIGADGQGSRIRSAIQPQDAPSPLLRMGIHMAYWFVPRIATDSNIRSTYNSPGGRMIMRRSHSPTQSQAYFFFRDESQDYSSIPRAPVEQQKEFWAQRFRDAGWQAERFIAGMKTTENWYCQEVVQVRTDTWHKGRVVILGDAAYCPSPFSGLGTTGSFVGAYVLAGEICRHSDNIPQAFANYDKTMRPFVDIIQNVRPQLLRLGFPTTRLGVAALHFLSWLACLLRLPQLITRFSREEKGGWEMPVYDELEGVNVDESRWRAL